jgi:hypothetical protein
MGCHVDMLDMFDMVTALITKNGKASSVEYESPCHFSC